MHRATAKAAKAMRERMEQELHGAWRAGYNYLHVYDPVEPVGRADTTQFAVRQYVFPAYSEHPPEPDGVRYRYTYDIKSTPDAAIQAAVSDGFPDGRVKLWRQS